MVSTPATLNRPVQDHVEGHQRVKTWGHGKEGVEIAHKLQGPICTKCGACVSPQMSLQCPHCMDSPPTTPTTHVQDHEECHQRVKRWGQGQGVVKSAHKLQGPWCSKMWCMCVSQNVFVAPSLQSPSAPMFKTM
jgi:hypothetical protein